MNVEYDSYELLFQLSLYFYQNMFNLEQKYIFIPLYNIYSGSQGNGNIGTGFPKLPLLSSTEAINNMT